MPSLKSRCRKIVFTAATKMEEARGGKLPLAPRREKSICMHLAGVLVEQTRISHVEHEKS